MAENETANAVAFLGEWLADGVQTPTREEIKLARSIALALAEIKRRSAPQQVITTADQLRALPLGSVLLDLDPRFTPSLSCQIECDDPEHPEYRYLAYVGGTCRWWLYGLATPPKGPFRVLHTPVVPDGR